jgi:hypothetical protein
LPVITDVIQKKRGSLLKFKFLLIESIIICLLTSTLSAKEITYGVGAALNNKIRIYFPVSISNYTIEPSLFYYSQDYLDPTLTVDANNRRIYRLGIGIFRNRNIYENLSLYYGLRGGYINDSNTKFYENSPNAVIDKSGYFLGPTLGVEYYVTKYFSLGLDLSLVISDTEGTLKVSNRTVNDVTTSSTKTNAEIIVRFHF